MEESRHEEGIIIPENYFAFVCEKTKAVFLVIKQYARISELIAAQLDLDPTLDYIELETSEAALKALVRYMEVHAGIESGSIPDMPLRSRSMIDICENHHDAEIMNSICSEGQLSDLYDLLNIALHLQVKSLLYLGCAKVASLIKGQPLDQIRQILDPTRTIPLEVREEAHQPTHSNAPPAQAEPQN